MAPFILSEQALTLFVQQYLLVFIRLGAMFMVMPILSSRLVNSRLRIVLAFAVTLIVVPLLPPLHAITEFSFQTLFIIFQELMLGIMVGFTFQIVFQVFVLAGQIVAMQMGLGFASMNDPVNGVNTTALSQFYLMLITLMFVSINGHIVMLTMLVESFTTFVPGQFSISGEQIWRFVGLGSWMFAASLLIALPVMTSLLFVNVAFGVMSRAAPQLNIFAIGFPFTLVCGLILIWLGLGSFTDKFANVMQYGFLFLHEFLR